LSNIQRVARGVILLMLALTLVLFGCTTSTKKTEPSRPAKTVTSKDVPTRVGLTRAYLSNDPRVNRFVGVDFDFTGPWDFREGPIDSLVETKIVPKKAGLESARFARATTAMKTKVTKGGETMETFGYFALTDEAYLSFGQAVAKGSADPLKTPERVLVFPLQVGKAWKDEIQLPAKPPIKLVAERKVVGVGTVRVPAGDFKDAAMIQVKKTLTETDGTRATSVGYEWYAPGVGIVAWIAGRNQEPEPLFKEAAFFQRLRSYTK